MSREETEGKRLELRTFTKRTYVWVDATGGFSCLGLHAFTFTGFVSNLNRIELNSQVFNLWLSCCGFVGVLVYDLICTFFSSLFLK